MMSVGMVGLVGTGGGVLGESQQGEEPKNKSGSPIRQNEARGMESHPLIALRARRLLFPHGAGGEGAGKPVLL